MAKSVKCVMMRQLQCWDDVEESCVLCLWRSFDATWSWSMCHHVSGFAWAEARNCVLCPSHVDMIL